MSDYQELQVMIARRLLKIADRAYSDATSGAICGDNSSNTVALLDVSLRALQTLKDYSDETMGRVIAAELAAREKTS